jgi:hypothetical protein
MGDLLQGSDGAIRLADALIRNGGGRTVLLRPYVAERLG